MTTQELRRMNQNYLAVSYFSLPASSSKARVSGDHPSLNFQELWPSVMSICLFTEVKGHGLC